METLLVKMFATALALSQVTTTPDAVKTAFSRDRDQHQVGQLLQAGCTHMMQAFDIENFNLDDLIATAMDDPQAIGGENNAFRGINFADLRTAYRQFCKNEEVETRVDLGDVIEMPSRSRCVIGGCGEKPVRVLGQTSDQRASKGALTHIGQCLGVSLT
jgi:hypothetical protein